MGCLSGCLSVCRCYLVFQPSDYSFQGCAHRPICPSQQLWCSMPDCRKALGCLHAPHACALCGCTWLLCCPGCWCAWFTCSVLPLGPVLQLAGVAAHLHAAKHCVWWSLVPASAWCGFCLIKTPAHVLSHVFSPEASWKGGRDCFGEVWKGSCCKTQLHPILFVCELVQNKPTAVRACSVVSRQRVTRACSVAGLQLSCTMCACHLGAM